MTNKNVQKQFCVNFKTFVHTYKLRSALKLETIIKDKKINSRCSKINVLFQ